MGGDIGMQLKPWSFWMLKVMGLGDAIGPARRATEVHFVDGLHCSQCAPVVEGTNVLDVR